MMTMIISNKKKKKRYEAVKVSASFLGRGSRLSSGERSLGNIREYKNLKIMSQPSLDHVIL